jgi:hypothetical protein
VAGIKPQALADGDLKRRLHDRDLTEEEQSNETI